MASWDDRMFVVKVYCKIEMNPWALTLTKPIPEAFELPASDWPEKTNRRLFVSFSHTKACNFP